jgi:hypothetical protein
MSSSVHTILSIVLGAMLASLGGFAAAQMNVWVDRARRAREAALLSGEVLAAVATLLRLAEEAAREGSVLDPIPFRFLRVARKEIGIYDRNRELLFSLADPALRARLHSLIVRLSIPLERLADDHARYAELRAIGPAQSQQADAVRAEMDSAFSYLMDSRKVIPELLAVLRPLAHSKFDNYSRIGRDGALIEKS